MSEQKLRKTVIEHTTRWNLPNGQLHRTDGPAIEYASGSKEWFQNGQLHRTDGPAVEWADGEKQWYQNGQRHRTDGPAYEGANGTKWWYQNGKIHRTDGPAYVGIHRKAWWICGVNLYYSRIINIPTVWGTYFMMVWLYYLEGTKLTEDYEKSYNHEWRIKEAS